MSTLFSLLRAARKRNFVHPPNPRPTILLAMLLLVLTGKNANGQLLNYGTYSLSTKAHFNALWTADRAEYTDLQRGKNWAMIPNVGLAFGLPSVSLNTGQIANYKQRQGETKAKLKSLELRYEVLLNEALNSLSIEIEKAQLEEQKLFILSGVAGIKKKIFDIHQEAFDKRAMKPLDYYREKLAYETTQQEYQIAIRTYQLVVLNVEKLAHYNTPQERIYYAEGEAEGIENTLDVAPSKLPRSVFIKSSSIR